MSGGGFQGVGRSKKSKKKQKKENWFEELNAGQCKELCKAVNAKCSGTKKDVIERLLDQEFLVQYSSNFKRYMITIDALKNECRKRMLQVSGNKFDLVLRIVQHEHGTGGDTLKRAATSIVVDETSGIEKHVAKKRKPSKPSPSTMYTRIQKRSDHVLRKNIKPIGGQKLTHRMFVISFILFWEVLIVIQKLIPSWSLMDVMLSYHHLLKILMTLTVLVTVKS